MCILQDATGPFLYGTLNRRPQMTFPRPRSDRMGSDTSSLMANHHHPFDMTGPPVSMTSSVSAYNTQDNNVWTPMPTTSGGSVVSGSSIRGESPMMMSPIQQLDQYQLSDNIVRPHPNQQRYSTIGRPGRGLHHLHHLNGNFVGNSGSPVRSVTIVAPGDPIPPNLQPQQQLQLQQMSSDHPQHQLRPLGPLTTSEDGSSLYYG
jgi:hypothetical protein